MSICIDCKKGADECSWLFKLRPVKGWEAKKVKCTDFVTYDVKSCPNFEENRKMKRVRRTRREIEEARALECKRAKAENKSKSENKKAGG